MAFNAQKFTELNQMTDEAYRAWRNDTGSAAKQAYYERCKARLDEALAQMKKSMDQKAD